MRSRHGLASAIQAVKKLKNELAPVREHQAQYYQALQRSTSQTDCAPFIAFILRLILHAVSAAATLQVAPQITPQVVHLL
jgi:Fic family protein